MKMFHISNIKVDFFTTLCLIDNIVHDLIDFFVDLCCVFLYESNHKPSVYHFLLCFISFISSGFRVLFL